MTIGALNFQFTPDSDPLHTPPSDNNETYTDSFGSGTTSAVPTSGATANPCAYNYDNSTSYYAVRACGYGQVNLIQGIAAGFTGTNKRLRIPAAGKWLTYAEIDPGREDAGTVVYSSAPGDSYTWTFNANGDSVAYRQWKSYDSFTGNTAVTLTSRSSDH